MLHSPPPKKKGGECCACTICPSANFMVSPSLHYQCMHRYWQRTAEEKKRGADHIYHYLHHYFCVVLCQCAGMCFLTTHTKRILCAITLGLITCVLFDASSMNWINPLVIYREYRNELKTAENCLWFNSGILLFNQVWENIHHHRPSMLHTAAERMGSGILLQHGQ